MVFGSGIAFYGIALLALRLGGSGIHFGRGRLSATYHHSSDALNVVMVVVMMMMKGHLTMCDSHHEICKHCHTKCVHERCRPQFINSSGGLLTRMLIIVLTGHFVINTVIDTLQYLHSVWRFIICIYFKTELNRTSIALTCQNKFHGFQSQNCSLK